jgi:U5 small nuclear ribonucleoprotein component
MKSSPLTVLLPDSRGKNYLFNFVDTPGHPAFNEEVTVGYRLADAVVLVVDCIEGVTL